MYKKREHFRKPNELYDVIESCSPGPYLELFARGKKAGWHVWGNQIEEYQPEWTTYKYNSFTKNESSQLRLLTNQAAYKAK